VMQKILYGLPLIHAVQLVRPLMAGLPVTDVSLHLAVLAAYGIVGYLIGVRLVHKRLSV
jgi:lipooligosaccharide transport system permease protein